MKFIVTAISFDPDNPTAISGPRNEEIDTDTNELFQTCSSEWDVEDMYEAFWNRLNGHWEQSFPEGKAKVKVVKVAAA